MADCCKHCADEHPGGHKHACVDCDAERGAAFVADYSDTLRSTKPSIACPYCEQKSCIAHGCSEHPAYTDGCPACVENTAAAIRGKTTYPSSAACPVCVDGDEPCELHQQGKTTNIDERVKAHRERREERYGPDRNTTTSLADGGRVARVDIHGPECLVPNATTTLARGKGDGIKSCELCGGTDFDAVTTLHVRCIDAHAEQERRAERARSERIIEAKRHWFIDEIAMHDLLAAIRGGDDA